MIRRMTLWAVALVATTLVAREPNYDESKIAPYTLEDPLTFVNGKKVTNWDEWKARRAEIVRIFEKEMFGRTPPKPEAVVAELLEEGPTLKGLAIRRQYRVWYKRDKTGPHLDWLVILPNRIKGIEPKVENGRVVCENETKVPVILFLNYRGNQHVVTDPEVFKCTGWSRNDKPHVVDHVIQESSRGELRRCDSTTPFPIETIIARGYAVMTACYCDISPDVEVRKGDPEELAYTGVFELWPRDPNADDNITAIGAWAWSLSRGLDLAEQIPEIDSTRSVATGCSRLAKTPLLAASRDERFAVCVPCQTGGGGAPLAKRDFGENVSTEMRAFPHWYCKAYAKYIDNEQAMKFDQHLLLASIAPRGLLVQGFPSNWFDTKGEYLACVAASPVWELRDSFRGLPKTGFPAEYSTAAIGDRLGYVRRGGEHGISGSDWLWTMDFADQIFKERPVMSIKGFTQTVKMLEGEQWWGVANYFAKEMPFTAQSKCIIDLTVNGYANQYASLLISDRGREIWCDRQCRFEIADGEIKVISSSGAPVEVVEAGKNLREAFLHASKHHFPPSGKTPDLAFIRSPQYNTWIELTYNQNEKDILAYAQSMLDNGLPPGVFMIDNTWQQNYGTWEFESSRFKDPKGMVEKLHQQGFKVMLWVCPWISMDTEPYRQLYTGKTWEGKKVPIGGFLNLAPAGLGERGDPAAVQWWNGKSALLDFTHPNANRWFTEQLDRLVKDYGVDGFKLDGGSLLYYTRGYHCFDKSVPSGDQANGYLKYALKYPVCEYRHAWKNGGQPIVMRLHDKNHKWSEVQALIPAMIAGGLLGHSFMCPDMVGGGNWVTFLPGQPFEEEMFVRSAQVHALCGQMQFSASPWRVLSKANQQIIRDLVKMRQEKFAEKFVALARECGHTGEPMIRNLEYMFPGCGYGSIQDEFMMGDFLLVAPQVEKGKATREVVIPAGNWKADDGSLVKGPCKLVVKTPLSRLPYFEKQP